MAIARICASPGDPPYILVLTTFDLDDHLYDAARAGATGFLLKTAPPEQRPSPGSRAGLQVGSGPTGRRPVPGLMDSGLARVSGLSGARKCGLAGHRWNHPPWQGRTMRVAGERRRTTSEDDVVPSQTISMQASAGRSSPASARLTASTLQALQRQAGNRAVVQTLAVQRQYDLRECPDIRPNRPYDMVHFRFDTRPLLPAHEHVHITVQDRTGHRKVHYYYDSWADRWRQAGGNGLGGNQLAAAKTQAIEWAVAKAKEHDIPFREPAPGRAQAPINLAEFPPLG